MLATQRPKSSEDKNTTVLAYLKGKKADIWSCGVILYAMLVGYLPFESANTQELYNDIIQGNFKVSHE